MVVLIERGYAARVATANAANRKPPINERQLYINRSERMAHIACDVSGES